MIVATKDNVVHLSGSLTRNQWLFIEAAALNLLKEHPQGIIIDCSELEHVSEEGAKTFLDAMRDIQAEGARMIVAGLPENVLRVIRSVPGVRSQLPIAATREEANASLRLSETAAAADSATISESGIIVPILPETDIGYGVTLAARVARETKLPIHLVYLMAVARQLPLATPLPEQEAEANEALARASQAARKQNVQAAVHLERVRDAAEGVLQIVRSYNAAYLVLSARMQESEAETFLQLADTLFRRAPCNVIIGRRALPQAGE